MRLLPGSLPSFTVVLTLTMISDDSEKDGAPGGQRLWKIFFFWSSFLSGPDQTVSGKMISISSVLGKRACTYLIPYAFRFFRWGWRYGKVDFAHSL